MSTTGLSGTEHGFLLLQQHYPDTAVSNMAFVVHLREDVPPSRLRRAVEDLGTVHPVLRSRFADTANGPVRRLVEDGTWLEYATSSSAPTSETLRTLARRPFDLGSGPVVRCVSFGDRVLFVVHHIVFDAHSTGPLVDALDRLLRGHSATPGRLPTLPATRARDIAFWRERLRDAATLPMRLPTDRPPPERPSFRTGLLGRALPGDARTAIRSFALARRVTPNVVFCAAYLRALHTFGAGDHLVVVVPVSLRSSRDLDQVGCMFTSLPVRAPVDRTVDLSESVRVLAAYWMESVRHRRVSFLDLMDLFPMDDELVHSPMLRHMFSYHETPSPVTPSHGTIERIEPVPLRLGHLDLEYRVIDEGVEARIALQYSEDVFDEPTARALLETTLRMLDEIPGDGAPP